MKFNTEEIDRLIQNRRSVFPEMYTGETIDHKIIGKILENANWAPTHGLTEPWRFSVFTGNGLRILADFQSDLYKNISEDAGNFSEMTYNKLRQRPMLCSHIIAIGMKRHEGKIPEIEEIEATACAVQNMYLTATAYGIGCYWGSGGITYLEEAKSFFDLEPSDKLLGFLHLGMPKKWPEGRRKPIEDKVRWIK